MLHRVEPSSRSLCDFNCQLRTAKASQKERFGPPAQSERQHRLDMDNRNVATLATAWTSLSSFYSGTWRLSRQTARALVAPLFLLWSDLWHARMWPPPKLLSTSPCQTLFRSLKGAKDLWTGSNLDLTSPC